MLQTLRIDTSVEVPVGIRRRDDFVIPDIADEPTDPDVWPPPTPVDHRYVIFLFQQISTLFLI